MAHQPPLYAMVCCSSVVFMLSSGNIKGEDPSTVDVELPFGGSVVVERPSTATVRSEVKAEDFSRILTRALHVDNISRRLVDELVTHIVCVDHFRRDEQHLAEDNPHQLANSETTYDKEVSQLQGASSCRSPGAERFFHWWSLQFRCVAATIGSGCVKGDDTSTVDVEHPCGGSAVVERPATATVTSAVKTEDVARLLTRALYRVNDIKNTYAELLAWLIAPAEPSPRSHHVKGASQRLHSVFVVRMLENTFPVAIPDVNPDFDAVTGVRTKVDATLLELLESLMTYIIYVDHVRRDERYWAGVNPRQLAFRETTYNKEVSQIQGNVLMPIACSLEQITTSRGISLDASAIQRLKQIEYKSPSNQYLGDMQAFVAFNSLQRLLTESRAFFAALGKAELL
ncbi:hypothetical protein LSAT2_029413 [Lamellibrachia satsuma]|nr:hypothetical protein LSAT2_029413 [Lamellibrachia satsuma]